MSRPRYAIFFSVALLGVVASMPAGSTQNPAIDGLYCGTALSGGDLVEVRTRLRVLANGLLTGTYDFADNGETTSGTVHEITKTSERQRTLVWVDRYGTGPVTMQFDETGESFDGKWNADPFDPAFRWDGKRCSDAIV